MKGVCEECIYKADCVEWRFCPYTGETIEKSFEMCEYVGEINIDGYLADVLVVESNTGIYYAAIMMPYAKEEFARDVAKKFVEKYKA